MLGFIGFLGVGKLILMDVLIKSFRVDGYSVGVLVVDLLLLLIGGVLFGD